jgi:hypothetical protein
MNTTFARRASIVAGRVGAVLLAVSGCGSGSSSSVDGGSTSMGGLRVSSVTSTAHTVTGGKPSPTETDSVQFVAIVTDTAGLDTIAGGELDDTAGHTYGAFEAGASKGTYSMTITYAQINQAAPVDLPSGMTRELVAKFFDNAGNMATASIELELACRDAYGLEGACGGSCSDPMFDPANCGSCGNVCPAGEACVHGSCATVGSQCINSRSIAPNTDCDQVCAAASQTCSGFNGTIYRDTGCGQAYLASDCGGGNYRFGGGAGYGFDAYSAKCPCT